MIKNYKLSILTLSKPLEWRYNIYSFYLETLVRFEHLHLSNCKGLTYLKPIHIKVGLNDIISEILLDIVYLSYVNGCSETVAGQHFCLSVTFLKFIRQISTRDHIKDIPVINLSVRGF